ncbi:lipopolysaccharide assembly protein LapA domain-containing protein [Kordiimonas sp.]|uniref:lipopolysaccharide assembly protein LapA domain-containing protein n=1 Tax=Kordiimonas sp. TaxID=1970157 RepID=UPI003A93068F
MDKTKYTLAMVAGGLLVLFAMQNIATVQLNFLFWSFYTSRFVVILLAVMVGFLLGWIWGAKKRVKTKETEGSEREG